MISESQTEILKRVPTWLLRVKAFHAAGGTLYVCTAGEAICVVALAALTVALDGGSALAVIAASLTAALGYIRKLKGDIRSRNGFDLKQKPNATTP